MITGLLFTLAQKPPRPANDTRDEGRHFPPAPVKKGKAPHNIVRLTQTIALVFTMSGTVLLTAAIANWSFDPASGLSIHSAAFAFTLPMGVSL